MFDKLKSIFGFEKNISEQKPVPPSEDSPKPKKQKRKKVERTLTPKEQATANGDPYISILKVDIDPNNINNGSFILDWNDKFLINLIKAGYKQKDSDTDNVIIDRWFQTVCRNIALEIYEQEQADPNNRDMRVVKTKDLGNGFSEIS